MSTGPWLIDGAEPNTSLRCRDPVIFLTLPPSRHNYINVETRDIRDTSGGPRRTSHRTPETLLSVSREQYLVSSLCKASPSIPTFSQYSTNRTETKAQSTLLNLTLPNSSTSSIEPPSSTQRPRDLCPYRHFLPWRLADPKTSMESRFDR